MRSLMMQGEGLVAAVGGGSGSAKLLILDANGNALKDEVSLLDRKDDTVERVAAMNGGGYVVLGRRTTANGDQNTTKLWVERLDAAYNSTTGRILEPGLGTTRGWAIAVAGDGIFVAGTTSKGRVDDATHPVLIRINAKDGTKVWSRIFDQVQNGSGRALAFSGNPKHPRLYYSGTGGSPVAHARFAQIDDGGKELWSLEASPQAAAEVEGALALAFNDQGQAFVAGFSHSSTSTKLLLSRFSS